MTLNAQQSKVVTANSTASRSTFMYRQILHIHVLKVKYVQWYENLAFYVPELDVKDAIVEIVSSLPPKKKIENGGALFFSSFLFSVCQWTVRGKKNGKRMKT